MFPETSPGFQRTTWPYIKKCRTLQSHRCENLESYIGTFFISLKLEFFLGLLQSSFWTPWDRDKEESVPIVRRLSELYSNQDVIRKKNILTFFFQSLSPYPHKSCYFFFLSSSFSFFSFFLLLFLPRSTKLLFSLIPSSSSSSSSYP
jgi:hypothetical protein